MLNNEFQLLSNNQDKYRPVYQKSASQINAVRNRIPGTENQRRWNV